MTKYLESNDITVTKFLDDVVPTYFEEQYKDLPHYLDSTVTKFLDENDISVTRFLHQDTNDTTVTKFLDGAIGSYLDSSVTKFLENDISVTKFLF